MTATQNYLPVLQAIGSWENSLMQLLRRLASRITPLFCSVSYVSSERAISRIRTRSILLICYAALSVIAQLRCALTLPSFGGCCVLGITGKN